MKKLYMSFLLSIYTTTLLGYTSIDLQNADALAKKRIIVNQTNNPELYRLDATITRAETIAIALLLNGIELPENHTCKDFFTDVTKVSVDNWICRAVEVAAANGVISTENQYFRPNETVSRAEAFAILYDASNFQPEEILTNFYYTESGIVDWQKNIFQSIYNSDLEIPNSTIGEEAEGLIFPVEEPYTNYTDTFGDPRSGGRTHEGTDIMAPKYTRMFAVTDGVITFAPTTEPAWGYALYLKGDDGYTYKYLHVNNDTPGTDDGSGGLEHAYADGIRKGVRVEAGDHIAYLGDSGNAEWTGSHLHFEITGPNKEVINPYTSLVASQQNGTPVTWSPNTEATRAEIFAFAYEILQKNN